MDSVAVSVFLWAATSGPDNPWTILGIAATAIATIAGAALSVAAYRSKQAADRGQQEIEGVKVSITALESALARADTERSRLDGELKGTRADLAEALTQIGKLRHDLDSERRRHAERVKVLARQIRALGAQPEGDDTP